MGGAVQGTLLRYAADLTTATTENLPLGELVFVTDAFVGLQDPLFGPRTITVLSRDGRLLAAQRLQSSGAMTLDRAALETVRRAAYPPVPADLDGERVPVAVEVIFAGSDR